jgi:hypothetical protein
MQFRNLLVTVRRIGQISVVAFVSYDLLLQQLVAVADCLRFLPIRQIATSITVVSKLKLYWITPFSYEAPHIAGTSNGGDNDRDGKKYR